MGKVGERPIGREHSDPPSTEAEVKYRIPATIPLKNGEPGRESGGRELT
jgi:hypothetical protein